MGPWNTETSIVNDNDRLVKFYFETDKGPGDITAMVSKGTTIEAAKGQLLKTFATAYITCELTSYEILDII